MSIPHQAADEVACLSFCFLVLTISIHHSENKVKHTAGQSFFVFGVDEDCYWPVVD